MSRTIQVTFDAHDPAGPLPLLGRARWATSTRPRPGASSRRARTPFEAWHAFLAEVGVPESEWNSASAAEDPDGDGPRLFFQRVPEGKTAKNRVHLDLRAAPGLQGEERMAALETECERLVAPAAPRGVARHEPAPPMSGWPHHDDRPARATSSAWTEGGPTRGPSWFTCDECATRALTRTEGGRLHD